VKHPNTKSSKTRNCPIILDILTDHIKQLLYYVNYIPLPLQYNTCKNIMVLIWSNKKTF